MAIVRNIASGGCAASTQCDDHSAATATHTTTTADGDAAGAAGDGTGVSAGEDADNVTPASSAAYP